MLTEASTNPQGFVTGYASDYDAGTVNLCETLKDMAYRNPYTAVMALRTYYEIRDRNWRLPLDAVRHLLYVNQLYPMLSE